MVKHAIKAETHKSLSKRAKSAGDIEAARKHNLNANWHEHVAGTIQEYSNNEIQSLAIVNGEVVPNGDSSWYKDTLSDPDIAAIDASKTRGQLLEMNNVTALALDVSNTLKASNSAEKLICHQVALAHQIAFEQAAKAYKEYDANIEVKRLQVVARMMSASQEALSTLSKMKTSGPQSVTVQHVHIQSGGQAVVGNIQK